MKTYLSFAMAILIMAFTSPGCKRLIEVPASKSQIEVQTVFSDSTLATSALLGAYYSMTQSTVSFKYLSLYSDEYAQTSGDPSLDEFYSNQVRPDNPLNQSLWGNLFSVIYQANAIIRETSNSPLSPTLKNQLTAEAKFLRAFANFYLVELYGHIPLVISPDVQENKTAFQVDEPTIFRQIIQDLNDAKATLQPSYKGSGKVRANRWAAAALLSRVYLFQNQHQQAADEATAVISSGQYSPLGTLETIFLAASKEAILQWWATGGAIPDGSALIPAAATSVPTYVLTAGLKQAFTAVDLRGSKWIATRTISTSGNSTTYNYPSKYKNRTANSGSAEYPMALRLAEQYLIRAEALAKLQRTSEAIADVNQTRTRAGLCPLSATTSQQDCLQAIASERRLELYGEYAHRFLDLKRRGELSAILSPIKTGWKNTASNLPIPQNELIYNSNLKQNEGY
ncbi:RagB/SusD family nutrient uptake outer membrane protein [Pedobacter rhizosphaerae]|uniref:Starch-binding associating with outer membrane n=1 Tax=Pedobacter rhizosphaerae TaxID=390241 RepID=A0A1H9SY99_9SPHI|nr:RagB/SusD family nutrient uptake outer membrane protein [Pedobacter rhizosphaerae]SER89856.1 Starch-binding associating with outer membrane [Pedobacter rhizosphaerae]